MKVNFSFLAAALHAGRNALLSMEMSNTRHPERAFRKARVRLAEVEKTIFLFGSSNTTNRDGEYINDNE
jgi:hypothetical protein